MNIADVIRIYLKALKVTLYSKIKICFYLNPSEITYYSPSKSISLITTHSKQILSVVHGPSSVTTLVCINKELNV